MRVPTWVAIIILVLEITLWGCAPYINGVCRHKAIYSALVYGDVGHKRVRIAWGPTPKKGVNHAQAQAFLEGEWKWICQVGESVEPCEQDNFQPVKYYSPKEFYDKFYWYLY